MIDWTMSGSTKPGKKITTKQVLKAIDKAAKIIKAGEEVARGKPNILLVSRKKIEKLVRGDREFAVMLDDANYRLSNQNICR